MNKKYIPLTILAITSLFASPSHADTPPPPAGLVQKTEPTTTPPPSPSVPMDVELKHTHDGSTTTLQKLSENKKAILIDFWTTWCGPCKAEMPNLIKTEKTYKDAGILVVGINLDNLKSADRFRINKKIEFPWLSAGDFFSTYPKLLNVNSVPRAVLLSPQGHVLFNGHPADPQLKKLLNSYLPRT